MPTIILMLIWCVLALQCLGQTQTEVSETDFGTLPGLICEDHENCVQLSQCEDGGTTKEQLKKCGGEMVCCKNGTQIITSVRSSRVRRQASRIRRERCGRRRPEGIGFKIQGLGNESNYGEFPWMMAILELNRTVDSTLLVFQCGGSIIHPQVVLTAAHCTKSKDAADFIVRAGEWDAQGDLELYPHQDRNVSRIISHADYTNDALFNDIALLVLDEPLVLGDPIQPVCLPAPDSDDDFDPSRCIVTGWGKDEFGEIGKYQALLKRIDVPIISRDECQNRLRGTRLSRFFNLHDSFICAGGQTAQDACTGDGGGPLFCPGRKLRPGEPYFQTGIVSWGIGCGEQNLPGVYTNVSRLRRWIDEQMDLLNFDKQYYTRKTMPRKKFIG